MIKKTPSNLKVNYKYNIRMPNANDSYLNFTNKLLTKYLDKLYDGNLLLIISPIFTIENEMFVLPTMDIDTSFNMGLNLISKFFSKSQNRNNWFCEFTGKNSFHIYLKYLVRVPNNNLIKTNISALRSLFFKNLKIPLMKYVDTQSSIRNVPIVRIGHRSDTNKMAIPILRLDRQWIITASSNKGFQNTFDKNLLADYIRTHIIPQNYINFNDYEKIVSVTLY